MTTTEVDSDELAKYKKAYDATHKKYGNLTDDEIDTIVSDRINAVVSDWLAEFAKIQLQTYLEEQKAKYEAAKLDYTKIISKPLKLREVALERVGTGDPTLVPDGDLE